MSTLTDINPSHNEVFWYSTLEWKYFLLMACQPRQKTYTSIYCKITNLDDMVLHQIFIKKHMVLFLDSAHPDESIYVKIQHIYIWYVMLIGVKVKSIRYPCAYTDVYAYTLLYGTSTYIRYVHLVSPMENILGEYWKT